MSDPSPFISNPYFLPVALAACLTGIATLAFIATHSAREARSSIFPVVREEEALKARRARYGMAFLSFFSGAIVAVWLITGGPAAYRSEVRLAQTIPTETPAVVQPAEAPTQAPAVGQPMENPTQAPPPTDTPRPPATSTPQPSPTPVPQESTPTPVLTPTATLDLSSAQPASSEARFGSITLAKGIKNKKPVEPSSNFLLDGNAVYAIFPYEGMREGVRWAVSWYRDDKEVMRNEELWKYGVKDVMYRYFIPGTDGKYRVVVYLEDRPISSADFEVQKMGIGGPKETPTP